MATNNSWFDENYYLNSKLIELQQSGQTQYQTTLQVYNAIVDAGYTPLTHFQAFSLSENTSPDQYFNTFEYLEAKAVQLNGLPNSSGTWTASSVAVALANAGYTNAYDHYAQWGWKEGVNPSNAFDNDAYIAENAAAAGITVAQCIATYSSLGVNPITQYETWGQAQGLNVIPVPAEDQVPPYDPAMNYDLTTSIDSIVGAASNDFIDGSLSANGALTLQSLDFINGGGGNDTLYVGMGQNADVTITPTRISNVEEIIVTNSGSGSGIATLNLSNVAGLQAVGVMDSENYYTNVTNLDSANIELSALSNTAAVNFTIKNAALVGTNAVDIVVDGQAAALSVQSTGTNDIESATVTATGADSTLASLVIGDNAGTTISSLVVDGDATLTVTANLGASVTSVNAALSGGVTLGLDGTAVTVVGSANNDTITRNGAGNDTIALGAGNDTITYTSGLSSADSIDGGLGTNTMIATVAQVNSTAITTAWTNVANIQTLQLSDAMAGDTITTANVASSINRVNLDGGNSAGTLNLAAGSDTVAALTAQALGSLTIDAAGAGTGDSLTILNTLTAGQMFNSTAADLVVTDFETVTLNTGSYNTAADQVAGIINVGTTNGLVITGANTLTQVASGEAITANTIDASGLTGAAALIMGTAAASGLVSITGSANSDTLLGDSSSSIHGGAGNDSIVGGTGNDTLHGGQGNDSITGQGGVDSINGNEGNDTMTFSSGQLRSNATVDGGDGTADVLSFTTYAQDTDGTAAVLSRVYNTEVLQLAGANEASSNVVMTNFANNSANFTTVNIGNQVSGGTATYGFDVSNASSTLNTVAVVAQQATSGVTVTSATFEFDRLVDTGADTLTFSNSIAAATAAGVTLSTVTANDEETISLFGNVAGDTLTITTLNASDLQTLNVTGAANVTVSNAIVGATALSTINAANATGTVDIDASNSTVNLTATAGVGATTVISGSGNDVITGNNGNDSLDGGSGADTITGGAGTDVIIGGTGADALTGGSGADAYTYTAVSQGGNVVTVGNAALLTAGDTITGFVSGTDTAVVTAATTYSGVTSGANTGWSILAGGGAKIITTSFDFQLGTSTSADVSSAIGVVTNGSAGDTAYAFIFDNQGTATTADDTYNIFQVVIASSHSGTALAAADTVSFIGVLDTTTLAAADITNA